MKIRIFLFCLLSSFTLQSSALCQGPLTPPGPPGPTMKTLDQIEAKLEKRIDILTLPGDNVSYQHVISQPGSYYLGGNLTGVSGRTGIGITVGDVTVDLNGFSVIGATGAFAGIYVQNGNNVRIHNGVVRGWPAEGIYCVGERNTFDHLRVADNGTIGLRAFGVANAVTNCVFSGNGTYGVRLGYNCIAKNCSAYNNGQYGISGDFHASISDCSSSDNKLDGIVVGRGSTVTGCSSGTNQGSGIRAFEGSTIANSSTYNNHAAGILADASTITHCTVSSGDADGISVSSNCIVLENTCEGNGNGAGVTNGAGIHATLNGSGNRIEGNNTVNNDIGIRVESGVNLIIKNSARGNGPTNNLNYVIAADNRYGPIVNLTPAGALAVNGNSAGSTVSSADPWANFAY